MTLLIDRDDNRLNSFQALKHRIWGSRAEEHEVVQDGYRDAGTALETRENSYVKAR